MSDYFDISPGGDMTISHGGRTVFTTAGRLVSLLPSATFGTPSVPETIAATFPDVSKSSSYLWTCESVYQGSGGSHGTYQFSCSNHGDAFVSALPQEWSKTTILAAAPAGCNLFAGTIRLNRTTNPSHAWDGNTIVVKQPTNVWIPLNGSLLVEQMVGMARAISIYIDGSGNLVLFQQQSVGPPPGGYSVGAFQDSFSTPQSGVDDTRRGGQWFAGSPGAGQLIYTDSSSTAWSAGAVITAYENSTGFPAYQSLSPIAGTPLLPADPTNYASTYTLDIVGEFGRAT